MEVDQVLDLPAYGGPQFLGRDLGRVDHQQLVVTDIEQGRALLPIQSASFQDLRLQAIVPGGEDFEAARLQAGVGLALMPDAGNGDAVIAGEDPGHRVRLFLSE